MGGYGSTRWNDHYRACTTNESFTFDLSAVPIRERMEANERIGYSYSWTSRGKQSGEMGVYYLPDKQSIVFIFQVSNDKQSKDVQQVIRLETVPLNFGGVRYWMLCPSCQKRTRTLHMPPYAPMHDVPFRCRDCWQLTYASCQDSRHPRGYLYEMLETSDKIDAIRRKLRTCRRGSKNYKRLHAKLDKLYSKHNVFADTYDVKSTQRLEMINQLMAELGRKS